MEYKPKSVHAIVERMVLYNAYRHLEAQVLAVNTDEGSEHVTLMVPHDNGASEAVYAHSDLATWKWRIQTDEPVNAALAAFEYARRGFPEGQRSDAEAVLNSLLTGQIDTVAVQTLLERLEVFHER